jgi:hypothetical protein
MNYLVVLSCASISALALTGAIGGTRGIREAAAAGPFNTVSFNGNFCQPNKASVDRLERHPNYGVYNSSTTDHANVECPVRVPLLNRGFGGGKVVVYDRSSTFDVSCTLYGLGADGTILWTNIQHSNGSGAASQTLTFSSQMTGFEQLNIECSIPPSQGGSVSHIEMYQVDI